MIATIYSTRKQKKNPPCLLLWAVAATTLLHVNIASQSSYAYAIWKVEAPAHVMCDDLNSVGQPENRKDVIGGSHSTTTTSKSYMKSHMTKLLIDARKIREAEKCFSGHVGKKMSFESSPKNKNKRNWDYSTSAFPYPLHFVTYSTDNLAATRERLLIEAECTGWFSSAKGMVPSDLPREFQAEFKHILAASRGGGFWLWKYPLLEMMLNSVPLGDYILYADAGCTINNKGRDRLIEWVQLLEEQNGLYDILGFESADKEETYTTEKIFQASAIPANDTSVRQSQQILATMTLVRNGAHAREVLAKSYEILDTDPYIITDIYNAETQMHMHSVGKGGTFVDNRHDQSISSVALKQMGAVVIPDESWPPDHNSSSPILASRIKDVEKPDLHKVRIWKEDKCSGENPLY